MKTAVVTGCSKGIGLAVAMELLAQGYRVIGLSRSRPILDNRSFEHRSVDLVGDIELPAKDILKDIDWIDLLVLNHGGALTFGTTEQLRLDDWRRCIEFSLISHVHLVEVVLERLKKSNEGCIVFTGSVVSQEPGYGNPHYSAAKAALLTYAKHLSIYLARYGIRVNTISPAAVESESLKENAKRHGDQSVDELTRIDMFVQQERDKAPLRRLTSPEEIAQMLISIVRTRSMTGQNIVIDGGKSRGT